jgi:hypothetical protein
MEAEIDRRAKEKVEEWKRGLIAELKRRIDLESDAPCDYNEGLDAALIDNTSSIVQYDPNFAKTYLREKGAMLDVLFDGNRELHFKAVNIYNEAIKKLNL